MAVGQTGNIHGGVRGMTWVPMGAWSSLPVHCLDDSPCKLASARVCRRAISDDIWAAT